MSAAGGDVRAFAWMYHLQLRQFPHNLWRFNLTEHELQAVLAPWVHDKPLELGERKWSPHQAMITVLEGPRLELQQLSMGRGWRAAQRESEDVTSHVIAAAAEAPQTDAAAPAVERPPGSAAEAAPHGGAEASVLSDPLALGVQLASLLGDDPARLLASWRQISIESPELSPSEALGRAEETLRSSRPGSR
jgi:hypothetical protein